VTQRRKAECPGVDPWLETVAAANDLDEKRTWVVWGTGGAPPPDMRDSLTEKRVAEEFAQSADPEWTDSPPEERWMVLLAADEDDVDALVAETHSARGYTPYLIPNRMVPRDAVEEVTEAPEEFA
jgi:hypothetical protein